MLSASNLSPLDEARLRFIAQGPHHLGPGDLQAHSLLGRDTPADGQLTRHYHPQKGSSLLVWCRSGYAVMVMVWWSGRGCWSWWSMWVRRCREVSDR